MNRIAQAALVGAATGALASIPTTYAALRMARKGSNVLLLAPRDNQQLAQYAQAFGGPHVHGPECQAAEAAPTPGQYL